MPEGQHFMRVFPCPKCGAVADVEFVAGVSDAEYAAAVGRYEKAQDAMAAASRFDHMRLMRLSDDLLRMQRGLEGPWLLCACPRCRFGWREKPLDVRDGPTPIFDGMAAGG